MEEALSIVARFCLRCCWELILLVTGIMTVGGSLSGGLSTVDSHEEEAKDPRKDTRRGL